MGQKLMTYYTQAAELGGLMGKIRLAVLTGVPSSRAAAVVDEPAVVALFDNCISKVRDEFAGSKVVDAAGTEVSSAEVSAIMPLGADDATLRVHIQVFLQLVSQRAVLTDPDKVIELITEAAAMTLGVARVGIWLLSEQGQAIECAGCYDARTQAINRGAVIHQADGPPYFDALRTSRTIAAHNAQDDPRTACFRDSYLIPLGITSMLDVPVWVKDSLVGVMCLEHIGPARVWNSDEETFAYLMSHLLSLSYEIAGTHHHEGHGAETSHN